MKLYRPKGKVQADFIEGPLKANGQEYEEGAYLVVVDGEPTYMSKADFEANYELSKKPQVRKAKTDKTAPAKTRAGKA